MFRYEINEKNKALLDLFDMFNYLSSMVDKEKINLTADLDQLNKSFENAVNSFKIIKQDLERLELIEALYNKSLKEMETIKNDDRELYLKFKQLENENEQLKKAIEILKECLDLKITCTSDSESSFKLESKCSECEIGLYEFDLLYNII